MTKFLSLFLLLHSFALISMAQQPGIKGILQDAADKSPVAGATVTISIQSDSAHKAIKSTITDTKGNFELLDIANESYIIEISFIGYQPLKRRVVVKDSLNNLGDLAFTKQGKDLSDVTIISTAPPVSKKEIQRLFCEKGEAQYHPVEFNNLGVILDNKEKAGELFKALQKIPGNQRIAFTLSKIEGLNNNEIAEIKINTPGLCKGSGNSQWLFHSCR